MGDSQVAQNAAGGARSLPASVRGNGYRSDDHRSGGRGRILLVEDSEDLARRLADDLELEGYQVRVAPDGEEGLELVSAFDPHLIILDLMLPGMEGFDLLGTLRRRGHDQPVLILSARSEQLDKLRGFRLGADDYVTKPFDLFELLARVDAVLRRSHPVEEGNGHFAFGELDVDERARTVRRDGEEVALTPKEFDLLLRLVKQPGTAISREALLRDVWNHKSHVRTRTVDTHILQLRKKLEPDPSSPRHLVTVPKVGYRFEA
jgi:DNA-binding response OmpR family regulator